MIVDALVTAATRALCAVGLHSWRDVSRPGSVFVVHVCRRGCGARKARITWRGRDD